MRVDNSVPAQVDDVTAIPPFGGDFNVSGGLYRHVSLMGVNTKGLVAFDHTARKDPFYFYKANWSPQPVTHIVGRRYKDHAYAVTDLKVYSNADTVTLTVNGITVETMRADRCEQWTCVFADVQLSVGRNLVTATGDHAGTLVEDSVEWSLATTDPYGHRTAGERLTALTRTFPVEVTDGRRVLEFRPSEDDALLASLEVTAGLSDGSGG